MEPTFDVYLTGATLDGFERSAVIASLAQLFKLDADAAEKLLAGKQQRVKSQCDKATALKYRTALSTAGAEVLVQRHATSNAEQAAPAASSGTFAQGKPSTLGAEPSARDKAPSAQGQEASTQPGQPPAASQGPATFTSQPGTERARFDAFDTGAKPIEFDQPSTASRTPSFLESLSIAPVGALMAEGSTEPPPQRINVPEFDVAPAGEQIPTLDDKPEPLSPRTDHLSLQSTDDSKA